MAKGSPCITLHAISIWWNYAIAASDVKGLVGYSEVAGGSEEDQRWGALPAECQVSCRSFHFTV